MEVLIPSQSEVISKQGYLLYGVMNHQIQLQRVNISGACRHASSPYERGDRQHEQEQSGYRPWGNWKCRSMWGRCPTFMLTFEQCE